MRLFEAPPSAGLPTRLADLVVWPSRNLTAHSARFLGVDDAISACSGTACLVIALHTLMQISQRRVVIVPAFTCPLVALAVAHCGLELKICDLAHERMDFDDAMLLGLVDDSCLAIIATHLAGRVLNLAPILAIAHAAGAHVLEDTATAFGAKIAGETVGLQGSFGFFSFAVGKGLSTFEGGLLISKNPALLSRAKAWALKNIPLRAGLEMLRAVQLLGLHLCYRPSLLPLCYRWPRLQATRRGDMLSALDDRFAGPIPLHTLGAWRQAVGSKAMRRLQAHQLDCERQAQTRIAQLQRWPGLKVMQDAPGACGVWPLLWLILPSESVCSVIFTELWLLPLGVSRLYAQALPDYPLLDHGVNCDGITHPEPKTVHAAVPNARQIAARSLTISNSLWLSDAHFERILAVLAKHLPGPTTAENLTPRVESAIAATALDQVVAVDPGGSAIA